MRHSLIRILMIAGLTAALGSGAARAEDDYLFDALKKPAYQKAWKTMLASERNVPGWLINFGKGGPGVAGPLKQITVDGRRMQASTVCKPHDCAGNELHILFSLDASSAVGSLVSEGGRPRYLGSPTPAQRMALDRAMAD